MFLFTLSLPLTTLIDSKIEVTNFLIILGCRNPFYYLVIAQFPSTEFILSGSTEPFGSELRAELLTVEVLSKDSGQALRIFLTDEVYFVFQRTVLENQKDCP